MRTRPQFEFAFAADGPKKKPEDGFAKKQTPCFRDFYGGEMRTTSEFKFACLPGGAKKKPATLRSSFWRPLVPEIRNAKVPANYRNLGHIHAPFISPHPPLTRTNLYEELAGNLCNPPPLTRTYLYIYFSGRLLFPVTFRVTRSIPLLF